MAAKICRRCGHDQVLHLAKLGGCSSCGCTKYAATSHGKRPWFVVVNEPGRAPRAYGPIDRWLDARKLAEARIDKVNNVRVRVVDERPSNMVVFDPRSEVR